MLRNWPLSAVSHSFIELHVFMQVEGASLCRCSSRKLWKITEEAIQSVRERGGRSNTASCRVSSGWRRKRAGESKGYLYRKKAGERKEGGNW